MAETVIVSKTETRSPKRSSPATKAAQDNADTKKSDSNAENATKPLAPPPRPAPAQGTPDYFNPGIGGGGSLSLEPNPFEQSFGAPPETPGGTKLPSVAALTSPSSLLPGGGATPFNWGGGSLRTGPLSPAMLSGPTNDYFGDTHHLRGFPTPNESSLRTGLTPGGSGSMFPAASPGAQAFLNGGATPNTLDFHRTALAAAAAKREAGLNQTQAQTQAQPQTQPPQQPPLPATSQPERLTNGGGAESGVKPATGPFDPHDNDAANGLFMLAQGRNGAQPQNKFAVQPPPPQAHAHPIPPPTIKTSPPMATVNGSGAPPSAARSDRTGSVVSDEMEQSRPSTRGKGKKNAAAAAAPATNGKRKRNEDQATKPPTAKQAKANGHTVMSHFSPEPEQSDEEEDDESMMDKEGGSKGKQTDEEKRKNFLERNRVAALKCRQRKKQWLANLQNKVELYGAENENLTAQISQLREEVVNLKTLLLAHKDCNVTQAQGLQGQFMQQPPMDHFNAQMNPYGMGPPGMPPQPVIANGGQRRYS